MTTRARELTHAIVMSLLKDVIITPVRDLGSPYQASADIAKSSWPEAGHPCSITCQGDTPLDAACHLYMVLCQWCSDPTAAELWGALSVHRAEAAVSDATKTKGRQP